MATTIGPDKQLSQCVDEFLKELEGDFQSPAMSKFQDYMPRCRKGVQSMEESLSVDKSHVHKLIGSLKEVFRVGELHGNNMATCADDLVKFGTTMSTTEPVLGNSFVKFGTLLNQISSLLTNLATSSKNILLFSLNLLFENELKGSRYKSEMKALAGQYQSARNQVEREERRALGQAGINIQDRVFTSEELSAKLVTERRKFQLGVCEYMLKVNDVKTKRGVDLAEHLVGYYQAQENYFSDGKTLLQALKSWESKFTAQISEMRAKQDDERKRLLAARDSLRGAMGIGVLKLQGPTHLDPQACTGLTEKTGYLGKRPENALRITRRPWPKRFCTASMQGFTLAHSHTHAPHVKVPVMHFQFKDCPEPIEGRKACFKLIAQNKTYTFDAESEKELQEWKQAMQNCQLKLFQGETQTTLQRQRSAYSGGMSTSSNARQLVKRIIAKIRSLPGNDRCVDCAAPDPEWLSVNLGILMCINCSGRHRELSVQYSRIRSLTLDQMKTPELLIALVMGNGLLNEVLEANLTDPKPTPDATTEKRQEFISNKYLQHKYIEHSTGKEALMQELAEAVDSRDIKQLLQVYAEGADLSAPLPTYSGGLTALHLAIELEDLTSLHIVDFLLGNGHTENCTDGEGNTPLHSAVVYDNPQCVKLLLNHGASITAKSNEGKTPLDIAEEKKFDECLELLQDAGKKKFSKCEHIDVDWGVGEEGEEDIYQTPIIDSQQPPAPSMKHSGTADNIAGDTSSPRLPVRSISGSKVPSPNSIGRHRPMSTHIDSRPSPHQMQSQRSADNLKLQRPPFQPTQPNIYPAPTEPAPPPPPRTVSKTAEALQSSGPSSVPIIPPRRKKRMTMLEQLENVNPSVLPKTLMIVVAEYDCDPDHRDELGFKEGERIVVTERLNKNWLRGYVESDPSRSGVFPENYVTEISSSSPP